MSEREEQIVTPARLEAFSDGVIAIAITLLILEIHVPEIPEGGTFWREIEHVIPSLIAFVVSFLTIGVMWINHHHLFRVIRRADQWLMILNTLLLMMITFINFPTILIGRYYNTSDYGAAVMFYTGTFALTAVIFNLLWRYASYKGRLLGEHANPLLVRGITRNYNIGLVAYLLAFGVSFFSPGLAVVLTAALAIFFVLPLRG